MILQLFADLMVCFLYGDGLTDTTGVSSGKGKSNSLIVGIGNSKELKKALIANENNNTIIISTQQKLYKVLEKATENQITDGKNPFDKLQKQHIVFIVDECHRAVSSEQMRDIKKFFPNSTWFGFTGTPIFEENKKQANGQLARTTHDQYGEPLHSYTIKNALDDGAVLGFQVEHEDMIEKNSLLNIIFNQLRSNQKYNAMTDDEVNKIIDEMDGVEKEKNIDNTIYEDENHIKSVIHKIFKPDNAYTKFDFQNGRPTKSAILTTSSIKMAKKYYFAIKEMMKDKNWLTTEFEKYPLRKGRTIDDADFPRIAITYSMEENKENSNTNETEMIKIIDQYNNYYHTAWAVDNIDRYNGDINNRLARKKGEFKEFGNQIDLIIVVDRLLTGFDAPTIQTLFVDRNLEYANLIQAFSRTNRTYPNKPKGLIVTFRKPHTMELNVNKATKLYSEEQDEDNLVYPTYETSKKRYKKAQNVLKTLVESPDDIDEKSPLEQRIEFVKAFQELNNAYQAIVTYDDYNKDFEASKAFQEQVKTLEDYSGIYNTVKGSLTKDIIKDTPENDFSDIEFFGENSIKYYDIDSLYIDKLLGNYSANNKDIRNEIEKALQKMKKSEIVKDVYREILNAIDKKQVDETEDILSVKRRYFSQKQQQGLNEFADEFFVSIEQLHLSAVQYNIGVEEIPNIMGIINSSDFETYKSKNPTESKLKYQPDIKRKWRELLDKSIVPLDDELK